MNINDFKMPTQHPYGMLQGYSHASEKESVLAMILSECVEFGIWKVVKTKYDHPTMVEDGLLKEVDGGYELTEKAKGLLYSVYYKGGIE